MNRDEFNLAQAKMWRKCAALSMVMFAPAFLAAPMLGVSWIECFWVWLVCSTPPTGIALWNARMYRLRAEGVDA